MVRPDRLPHPIHRTHTKMALCQATTKAGRACQCKARIGFATCGRHKNVVADVVHVCGAVKVDGTRCLKACADGDTMCGLHRRVADRREQARREDIVWNEVLDLLWVPGANATLTDLNNIVTDAHDRGWITAQVADRLLVSVYVHWRAHLAIHPQPVKPTTDLQRIARDTQNVHTKEVTKQMNEGTKYLVEIPVPEDQDTLAEMEIAWMNKKTTQLKRVMADVKKWYKKNSCVEANDYLYKRMLDGLWVRVKNDDELVQRLWEEALESVGMCCQGHLSRLTNVLVGFTDEVKAEIPVGELLQHKMAAIANKDVSVDSKVAEAQSVLAELKVPMEQHSAWLEAF